MHSLAEAAKQQAHEKIRPQAMAKVLKEEEEMEKERKKEMQRKRRREKALQDQKIKAEQQAKALEEASRREAELAAERKEAAKKRAEQEGPTPVDYDMDDDVSIIPDDDGPKTKKRKTGPAKKGRQPKENRESLKEPLASGDVEMGDVGKPQIVEPITAPPVKEGGR